MKFEPHGYQSRAIGWVVSHPRCLLFMEMGLGKTAVCLSAVKRLLDYGEIGRVLVIAPKKVAESTWSDEAAQWDHLRELRVSNLTGTERQRVAALERDADVYVIGRDSVVWLTEHLGKNFGFDMVIIDELTSFKNHRSLRFKALKRVLPLVGRVVGLTGTPTPNGLLDLWAQVYCIDQGKRLGRFITHYRERWFTPVMHNNIIVKCPPKAGAEEEIMGLLSDIALAMRSEDWLSLPALIVEDRRVKLPEAKMKAYRKFEREKVLELTVSGEPLTADSAAALVNKLAQYANGAVYSEGEGGVKSVRAIHEEKLAALMEVYESEESPLLVFYQYIHDRDRIIFHFRRPGIRLRVYQDAGDLRDWNAGKIDILLAHPASTAFGLNMQKGGSRIAWFSTGWNLELYQQANARLHRQGQTRPVRVFNLVAAGTVDERMAEALKGKKRTQDSVVKSLAGEIVKQNTK